ncbi:MAG: enoyl-CoA hydratase/isomerase family protein [Acidimicrobiales bacterium]
MSEPTVIVKREGHLTTITLNRPERLNAIDGDMARQLGEAFAEFENDKGQWVAILTGNGRAFCTGNDLEAMTRGGAGAGGGARPGSHGPGFASITKRFPIYKPVIAAINGYAVAGGLELALVCDILVAADSAKLGLTEVQWSLVPTGGGTQRLPRSIPRAWANYMILTGEPISAEQAQSIGLISHVVAGDDLLTTARGIAETILSRGPLAVWAAKEAMLRGQDMSLDQGLAYEDAISAQVLRSSDAKEGPLAFVEKRPPNFKAE